jgi:hypothetical protein
VRDRFENLDGVPNGRVSGECPHCARLTTLTIVDHSVIATDGSGSERVVLVNLTLTCDWCRKSSVYLRHADTKSGQQGASTRYTTRSIEQVWPKQTPRALAQEAPPQVQSVFAEAALAEAAGAFVLAGIGYRAAVEQIAKERGAPGRTLYERISSLTSMGVLQETVDAFHEARAVGNDAAHDGLAYSAEEIADIAELIEEAVLVLYVQPAQRALMAAQRAARRATAKTSSAP